MQSRFAAAHEAQGRSPEHLIRRTLQLLHLQEGMRRQQRDPSEEQVRRPFRRHGQVWGGAGQGRRRGYGTHALATRLRCSGATL